MNFGMRPDPESNKYWKFNKKDVFGSSNIIYSGDIDLRKFTSPVKNQGPSESCVAHAMISALELKRIQKFGRDKHINLSVMDLYYGARDMMTPKETNKDAGTYIYLAAEVLRKLGVCREEMWPFDFSKIYVPPSIMTTRESYLNKITSCYKIVETGWDRVDAFQQNLAFGNPLIVGFDVGKNWTGYNSSSDPILPTEFENVKGKHAVLIVGIVNNLFIIQNSWGEFWGHSGYGYLRPETIASDSCRDPWVITDSTSDIWKE